MAESDFIINARISANTSDFEKGIKRAGNAMRSTTSDIDLLSSKLKTAVSALGGLFAINKIKQFGSESVKAFREQERQIKLLASTIKVTGASAWTSSKEITSFAQSLQKVTNYGDETIISMQNVLLGFKNIQGDNFKEATKAILDMSTVMGMDLTSAAQAVGKALDDPIKGINSLTRQGFYFTDSQKAMLKSLVETGKQAEAQKIILNELSTTYGGAAEATADIGEQLKNTWGDVKEQIGGAIAEISDGFLKFVKDFLDAILNMNEHTKRFISTFAKTALALGGLTTAVYVLKTALDALKSHPIIALLSVAISGVSALVGLFSTASNELEDEAKKIKRLNESAKGILSTSEKEAKLTANQVNELVKLYPELTNKIKANNTTTEQALEIQKKVNEQKVLKLYREQLKELDEMDETYKGLVEDLDDYNKSVSKVYDSQEQMRENKRAVEYHKNELRQQLKESKDEINRYVLEINANLEGAGYKLDEKTRKLIKIEVQADEDSINSAGEIINQSVKSWKQYLSEALDVDEFKFEKGREAVKLYKDRLVKTLQEGEEISKSLGIPFSKTEYLEKQLEEIHGKIIQLVGIDPSEINDPFKLEELEKENTALGSLVKLYKDLQSQSVDVRIEELKKSIDDLTLSEDELYLKELQTKGATDEQIKVARNLLATKQQMISLDEQRQRDLEIIDSYDLKILEQKIENEENWTTEHERLSIERLNIEREEELSNAKSAEARYKINIYYDEKVTEEKKKHQKERLKNIKYVTDAVKKLSKDGLEKIGESLVKGGESWEDFKYEALDALAGVLEGIAAQLSAMATASLMAEDYKNAIIGFAGAAAALVAAGALKAVVSQMKDMKGSVDGITSSMQKFSEEMKQLLENISDTSSLLSGVNSIRTIIGTLTNQLNSSMEGIDEYSKLYTNTQNKVIRNSKNLSSAMGYFKSIKEYHPLALTDEQMDKIDDYYNEYKKMELYTKELKTAYSTLIESVDNFNSSLLNSIEESRTLVRSYKEMYDSMNVLKEISSLGYSNELTTQMSYVYRKYVQILHNAQFALIEQTKQALYEDLISAGNEIGSTLTDSIINGATKEEFLSSMKNYLKTNLIKLAIYTEEFNEKLADAGADLATALSSGSSLTGVRNQLEELWVSASENAIKAEELLNEAFGDIADDIDSSSSKVEDALTSLEKLIKSFKESITDLGGDIATNLVNGLANGLSESDFLSNMKTWLRKMIIQTVVYTDSMKAEIESIGKVISEGLSEGLSEDSLHKIRRDLSYIFFNTSRQMSSIDSILDSVFSGYATGTQNATAGLHLVGEAGPELVKFRGGEQVLNAGNTRQALGNISGNTNNFSVNFYDTKDTTAFSMLQQLRNYNRQMAVNGII